MGKKLYVGNLPFASTDADLQSLFSQVGTVESARVIQDNYTGRSKGFGFVEMSSDEEAAKGVEKFNGYSMDNRSIVVSEARPQEPRREGGSGGGFRPRREGGFDRPRGGFGGGFGGGRR